MSMDEFRDLPDPEDFPLRDAPDDELAELIDQAEAELIDTESDVTSEDLSEDDLMNNGALPEDLERSRLGVNEAEQDRNDPGHEDSIDDRLRQEEFDPNTATVPDPLKEAELRDDDSTPLD